MLTGRLRLEMDTVWCANVLLGLSWATSQGRFSGALGRETETSAEQGGTPATSCWVTLGNHARDWESQTCVIVLPLTLSLCKSERVFNPCKIKDEIGLFFLQQILSVPGNCKALGIRYE